MTSWQLHLFVTITFGFTSSYVPFTDIEYILFNRYAKFQSVASITLHFPDNFGGDTSQINYIGFKGEATQVTTWPRIKWVLLICFLDQVLVPYMTLFPVYD